MDASEGRFASLVLMSWILVAKLSVCLGMQMMNLALLPVTPFEVTPSMEYSAIKEGKRAALEERSAF